MILPSIRAVLWAGLFLAASGARAQGTVLEDVPPAEPQPVQEEMPPAEPQPVQEEAPLAEPQAVDESQVPMTEPAQQEVPAPMPVEAREEMYPPVTPAARPLTQESMQTCRMYEQERWQDLGYGPINACLNGIDRWVSDYNGQGFKFGTWAGAMLAATATTYYQSGDGGHTWVPIGPKTDVASIEALAPVLTGEHVATGVAATVTPDERKSCSLLLNGQWQSTLLTLDQCAVELDRAPDYYDADGFKYGYWSGTFLVADKNNVFASTSNDDKWKTLRPRWKTAGQ